MTGYDFHPEAALDLGEIWEFIADDPAHRKMRDEWAPGRDLTG